VFLQAVAAVALDAPWLGREQAAPSLARLTVILLDANYGRGGC
jgi:hypothetical protein